MNVTNLRTRLDRWRERNPLRAWRVDRGLTQADIAISMRRSARSVASYESGAFGLSEEMLATIAELMGRSTSAVRKEWKRWQDDRPPVR